MFRDWFVPTLLIIGAFYSFIYSPGTSEEKGPDADWDGATKTQFRPLANMEISPAKYKELMKDRDFGKVML